MDPGSIGAEAGVWPAKNSGAAIRFARPGATPTLAPVRDHVPSPAALARALRGTGRPGMAWLDRARPAADLLPAGGSSLLVADPAEFWTGRSEAEWADFARAWEDRAAAEPGAVAVGWVEYGGTFRFAAYPRFPAGIPPWWAEAVRGSGVAAGGGPPRLSFREEVSRQEYCRWVDRAREHIAAGYIYQVNLAHRLVAPWPPGADPSRLNERTANPARK